MEKSIKLTLAVLLGLCLFDMPYGFYQLVRFVAMIGFVILSFKSNERKRQNETIIYAVLAVLFQPLFKISLGRELWTIVDAFVAIGLVVTVIKK